MSKIFGARELKVLCRLGDIMLPESEEFPAFSRLGCIEHVDDVAGSAPPDDIGLLKLALKLLSFLPGFALRWTFRQTQHPDAWPEFLAANLRLLGIALRSMVLALYFSGKTGRDYDGRPVHDLMGFEVVRVPKGA